MSQKFCVDTFKNIENLNPEELQELKSRLGEMTFGEILDLLSDCCLDPLKTAIELSRYAAAEEGIVSEIYDLSLSLVLFDEVLRAKKPEPGEDSELHIDCLSGFLKDLLTVTNAVLDQGDYHPLLAFMFDSTTRTLDKSLIKALELHHMEQEDFPGYEARVEILGKEDGAATFDLSKHPYVRAYLLGGGYVR